MKVTASDAPAEVAPERIRALVAATLRRVEQDLETVSISFVDPTQMQQLNAKHRGKDAPTDVLSFPFDDSFPQGRGGEVVICREVAAGSPITGGSLTDELEYLVVHGVLHLAGHEDETESGAAQMDRLTTGIISDMTQHHDG